MNNDELVEIDNKPLPPKMGDKFREKAIGFEYSYQGRSGDKVVLNSFEPKVYPDIEVPQTEFVRDYQSTALPNQPQDE